MNHPTCETCEHFDLLNEVCRSKPPTLVITGPNQVSGLFPPVKKSGWCSQHTDLQPGALRLVRDTQ